MNTPDFGHFTRSMIQSLENIKFTPSQGVCTPSPTILVHHHHHVYGSQQGQEQQLSDAYMAGVAAGRAGALQTNNVLIPAAMYESPHRHSRFVENNNDKQPVEGDGHENAGDEDDGDAKSIDGDKHRSNQSAPLHCIKNDANATERREKHFGVPSKACSSANSQELLDMAFSLLAAHGVHWVESAEEIPSEIFDLASLLITLQIPTTLISLPASEFNGMDNQRLNARQRRTLRRSQERAWKEMDLLKNKNHPGTEAPQHVKRTYSPSCIEYGVNPAALADYNQCNPYVMAHPAQCMPPSPGSPQSYPIYPVMGQMGHPAPYTNFVPQYTQIGQMYHHGYHAPPRMLSRFASGSSSQQKAK
jgi:hypothetical protein